MTKKKKKLTPAQAELVQNHIALARQVAHKHRHWAQGDRLAMEDLEGEAYLGLVQAAINWDKKLGPFIPYAKKTIKNVLIQADRDHSLPFNLPWNEHRIVRDIRRAVNAGADENPQAVARALNVNVNKITALWPYYNKSHSGAGSIKNNLSESGEAMDMTLEYSLESEDKPVDEQVTSIVMAEAVNKALASLPPTHRQIISYRFGFETGEPMLSAEIMTLMGLGRAEYEAAEDAAMEKVEAILRGYKGIRTENE